MNMPSVPKADLIAVAQAAVAVAVAFGAPLNADQQKSLLALATIIAAILVTADVKRRGNWAANADKIAAATKPAQAPQAFYAGTGTAPGVMVSPSTTTTGHVSAGYTVADVKKAQAAAKKKQAPKKKP